MPLCTDKKCSRWVVLDAERCRVEESCKRHRHRGKEALQKARSVLDQLLVGGVISFGNTPEHLEATAHCAGRCLYVVIAATSSWRLARSEIDTEQAYLTIVTLGVP